MITIAVIVGVVYAVVAVWLAYELIHAPTIDDWHDECVKARDTKKPEIKG